MYPYLDSDLRFRIANLEKNITQNVHVGSIMQDKSKIIKIYTDTKLDMNLLNTIVKARSQSDQNDNMHSIMT